jgi:hypothetical protein
MNLCINNSKELRNASYDVNWILCIVWKHNERKWNVVFYVRTSCTFEELFRNVLRYNLKHFCSQ